MADLGPQTHLDPTDEITLEAIKKRAVSGVVILTGRTFILSVVTLIATGLLTVFLEPDEFGVFWIVSAVVNFLAYFSDIGLAAALIQKKEKVTNLDLRTTFTIQQLLVAVLLFILVISTPIFRSMYSLSTEEIILMYALGVSLLISSLKTIPSVLLERDMEFNKLVIPHVLENLTFSVVAVTLAWLGYGVGSFIYAVLARGFVGLIAIYIIKPWVPRFSISRKSLKTLTTFGVPYQANTLLATVKDDGMTMVLGGILGSTGLGFLGWAQKWGQAPLRFFMDHVIKVTFPAFSRMQDNKDELSRGVSRSIFFICFLVFPSLIALLILAPILVEIIPKYDKWEPALKALSLIGISTLFAAVTTQLTNLLNAIGKIKVTFKLMIMWTALTWLIVPFLAIKYGVTGAAAGYAIVSSTSVVAIYITRRYVEFSLKDTVFKPLLSAIVMGIVVLILGMNLPHNAFVFALLVFIGFAVYMGTSYLIIGSSIIQDAKKSFRTLFSR